MESNDNIKLQNMESLSNLHELYKNDEYMIQKLHGYICNQLPIILQNIKEQQIKRKARFDEMTTEQDEFVQGFMNNNQYFYVQNTNYFFFYDGFHYQLYSEDDILYHVLTSINRNRQLISWKYKTKQNIMKKIKNNSLLTSIPESDTIQNVLESLTNNLFSSRELAKYFLCVIGDNILKKENKLVHFIHQNAKNFIRNLDSYSFMAIGHHLSQTFKHKYYDHEYENFRIININKSVKNESSWTPLLKNNFVDLLCVACHYSNRFSSSDNYIEHFCNNQNVTNNVFFIKNTEPESLVKSFIQQYVDDFNSFRERSNSWFTNNDTTENDTKPQISWKNMQYLWNLFLDEREIPSVLFMNNLKSILIKQLPESYNENLDLFENVFSKYLPTIQKFLHFWNDQIVVDENEHDLETEELLILFKKWCGLNNFSHLNICVKEIFDLICYYFPQIHIEKDKYLSGIRCLLWDKQLDIQTALENLKEELKINKKNDENSQTNKSFYEIYLFYCKFTSNDNNKQIASKFYFEKYIFDNYSEYISNNTLINDWYV